MPSGETFDGVAGLRQALLARPEVFVGTFAEKLMTYALGRGVTYSDAPAVRGSIARRLSMATASPLSWEPLCKARRFR